MATFSVTANELKYASGSSWTSGKARQGVYSGTRYEGAINLAGLSGLDFSNIAVSQIQMRVTFGPAGGDSTKYLTFYKATKNSISGSIASMRGDSIMKSLSASNPLNAARNFCRMASSVRCGVSHFCFPLNLPLHCQMTRRYLSLECHTLLPYSPPQQPQTSFPAKQFVP